MLRFVLDSGQGIEIAETERELLRKAETRLAIASGFLQQHIGQFSSSGIAIHLLVDGITDLCNQLKSKAREQGDSALEGFLDVIDWTPTSGRPRAKIDEGWLRQAKETHRLDNTTIASLLNVSAKTVSRRCLQSQLRELSMSSPKYTTITDEELTNLKTSYCDRMPGIGWKFLLGQLSAYQIWVPRDRVRNLLREVKNQAVDHSEGARALTRTIATIPRGYSVPGLGSVWHHDDQLGLVTAGR